MARTGRPKLPEKSRRTERIYVYLTSDELDELRRLRKENRELRMDREILKKAAFFAKESR